MTDEPQSPDDKLTKQNKNIDAEVIDTQVNDSDAIEETIIESSPTDQEQLKPQVKKVKTGLLWLFSVFNFIVIALLCAGAYWYYTQIYKVDSSQQTAITELSQQLNNQMQDIQGNVEDLKRNTQAIDSRVTSNSDSTQQSLLSLQQKMQQEMKEEIEENAQTNAKMTKALTKRLAEMSGRRPSDWLLAEANYLVNLASRKLYIEKDVRTAMTLLKEADDRLEDLSDPSLFTVRALIAADIQTLNQINSTSTSSITLALAAMLPKVSELPLDKLQLPEELGEQKDKLSEDVNDWRSNLAVTWEAIVGDLISIEKIDKPLEPYLAERQQWLIEQQLKHALSQAQTAVLNEQIDVYQSSTQQAIQLINEHYQLEDPQVSQFLGTLQELLKVDFSRNYPNKLESQAALKDIIEQRIMALFNNEITAEPESSGNAL